MMVARSRFATALGQMNASWPLPQAAEVFAQAGVPIFPCAPGGKQPITSRGFHDATTNPAQVQAWWRRFPEANIGMPTGAASGLVVVDVDVHGPVNGYDVLARAQRAGLVSGPEVVARSPSGGLHLYFPASQGTQQRSWQAGRAGVDFRGDGGYIIIPPSHRTANGADALYRVEAINPEPAMGVDAQRLRDFLDPKPPPRPRPAGDSMNPGETAARLAGWAARMPEGQRNASVFWAACKMAENGIDHTTAAQSLIEATEQPDFGAGEISRTVANAYQRVQPATTATSSARPERGGSFDSPPRGRPAHASVGRGLS